MDHRSVKSTKGQTSRFRFSAMDVVILLLVLLTAAGAFAGWVWQLVSEYSEKTGVDEFLVTFRIVDTHREVVNGLAFGDRIYLEEDDSYIGYLCGNFEFSPVEDNEVTAVEDIVGTVSMTCNGKMPAENNMSDEAAMAGGNKKIPGRTLFLSGSGLQITPGETLVVRTERELLTIRILSVTQVNH